MNDEQIIKDAQYRKGLSIAFFNATNSAISLIVATPELRTNKKEMLDEVCKVRDFFLEEHKKYYSEVIANVGKNYDSKATIEKLKAAKSIDELKNLWVGLSEDERRDGDILAEVKKLKEQYAKN